VNRSCFAELTIFPHFRAISASIKTSELFGKFTRYNLTENMRTAAGEEELRKLLTEIGNGRNFLKTTVGDKEIDSDVIQLPSGMSVDTPKELIDFVFPPEALAAPLERKWMLVNGEAEPNEIF